MRNGIDQWFLNKQNNHYLAGHYSSNPPIEAAKWSTLDSTIDNWRHGMPNLTQNKVTKLLDGVKRDAVEVVIPDVKGGSQRIDLFPDKTSGWITTKMTYQLDDNGGLRWTERCDYEYNKDLDKNYSHSCHPPALC